MTGTTTVRKKGSERRDTSPSAQGVDHRRSDSDSSEEPWDQKNGIAMRTLDEQFEDLDDGELPSLQRKPAVGGKRMGGRIVNGQRTTTRPLSPPSQAGLVTPEKKEQRKFWGQLDADSPEERENSFDEGPHDEKEAREAAKRREERRRKEQRREEQRREDLSSALDDDYDSSFGASQTFETIETADDPEVTLCGNTFQAINEMCGGNTWLSRSPEKAIEHKTVVDTRTPVDPPEGEEEEHTAIEVEFVEPTKDVSPQRKNAYLTAMAKKAKEEFEKNKANAKKDTDAQRALASSPSMESAESEDLYNSFNAAEKRKFLKLINGGINPAEASQRVVEEREDKKDKEKAHSSRKGRASRLAFWKKSTAAHKNKASTVDDKTSSAATTPERQSEETGKEATQAVSSEPEKSREVQPAVEKPVEQITIAVEAPGTPVEAADAVKPEKASPGQGDVDTTHPESDSEEDLGQFAKSGINYYDAVRRELPDEDSDRSIPQVSSKEAGKDRRSRRSTTPKGFIHLNEEERSKDASKSERSRSTPRPPLAKKSKEIDSLPAAGLLAVAQGSHSDESAEKSASRTVKSLLQPTPNRDATIGEEDADALERIEKELLRPAAVVSASPEPLRKSPKSSTRAVDMVPSESSAHGKQMSTSSKQSSTLSKRNKQKEDDSATPANVPTEKKKDDAVGLEGMDVDIDTYMNAADIYSLNGGMNYDGTSVYTAGTGVTGASSYTQSSRVRRPGAAKTRLEKAKEADKKKQNGWVESMREAAASSNRVWQPEVGWVDYEDPKNENVETVDSKEKIHINDRSFKSQKNKNREVELDASGESVQLPFPPEWEKERSEMLESAMNISVGPESSFTDVEEKKVESQDRAIVSDGLADVTSSKTAESITSTMSSKPKGWVESMRVASAELAKDGHVWDPEHGWTNVNEKRDVEAGTSDVVDFDVPSHAGQEGRDMESAEEQTETEFLSEDDSPPLSDDSARAIDAEEREPRAVAIPLPPKDGGRKLNQWIEKSEKVPKKQSERSMESSDKAVASAGTTDEKYMQLADNGSVRSSAVPGASLPSGVQTERHDADNGSVRSSAVPGASLPSGVQTERHDTSEDDEEDDHAPLLNNTGSFPTSNDRPLSPIVDIVREKVGEEDMDLFPQESRERRAARSEETEGVSAQNIVSPRAGYSEQSLQGSTKSTGSSRRGAGPVDVDEVDETWESDDDQRHSTGWDADSYPMEDASRSFDSKSGTGSGSGSSWPSKKVPILKRSKRDTTPLRTRTAQSTDLPVVSPADAGPITSKPTSDEPEHQPGSPRGSKPTSDEPEHRPDARSRGYSKPHQASQHASPSVKDRLQQFESHHDDGEPQKQERNGNANAEWKSFMGKKVRAESAAAASQHQGRGGIEEPEGDKFPYKLRSEEGKAYVRSVGEHKTAKEDDSLFEFGEKGLGATNKRRAGLEVAELSPIRRRNDDSDEIETYIYGSEAYGPEEGDKKSFFSRLAECAAPMMPANKKSKDDSVPAAHLAFLRSSQTRQSPGAKQSPSRYIPTSLCGRPDIIQEDDDAEESVYSEKLEEPESIKKSTQSSMERPRSVSNPRGSSSVVSADEFGAKTAYLEALAMKTAVSKPRRSESRRRGRSSANSSVSTSSSNHSEKWKAFLDRKKASGSSPAQSRASESSVSRAAEKYASAQLEEMMSKMRSNSAPRSYRPSQGNNTSGESSMYTSGDSRSPDKSNLNRLDDEDSSMSKRKPDSVSRAAEDLAAARVEAMMAALSSSHMVDEGEI